MQAIYKRMGLTEKEYSAKLEEMYNSGMSHQSIANQLKCHRDVIEKHCKKYDIKSRNQLERRKVRCKHIDLDDKEKEILDGIMLADGHLLSSPIAARLSYGSKYLPTLEDISKQMSSMKFTNFWQSKKTACWHFKSHSYAELLEERNRWYPDGTKKVPDDVRITPLSCYWWFVGDGYVVDYGVMLCTDSFDDNDIGLLMKKLSENGFSSHLVKSNNRIRIEGDSAPSFLSWISSEVDISDQYKYKWHHGKRMKI